LNVNVGKVLNGLKFLKSSQLSLRCLPLSPVTVGMGAVSELRNLSVPASAIMQIMAEPTSLNFRN